MAELPGGDQDFGAAVFQAVEERLGTEGGKESAGNGADFERTQETIKDGGVAGQEEKDPLPFLDAERFEIIGKLIGQSVKLEES